MPGHEKCNGGSHQGRGGGHRGNRPHAFAGEVAEKTEGEGDNPDGRDRATTGEGDQWVKWSLVGFVVHFVSCWICVSRSPMRQAAARMVSVIELAAFMVFTRHSVLFEYVPERLEPVTTFLQRRQGEENLSPNPPERTPVGDMYGGHWFETGPHSPDPQEPTTNTTSHITDHEIDPHLPMHTTTVNADPDGRPPGAGPAGDPGRSPVAR